MASSFKVRVFISAVQEIFHELILYTNHLKNFTYLGSRIRHDNGERSSLRASYPRALAAGQEKETVM